QKWALGLVAGSEPEVVGMGAAAAVAGLAADADLDEVAAAEARARGVDQAAGRGVAAGAQAMKLVGERSAQGLLVADLHGPAAPCGEQAIHDLALVGRRAGTGDLAEERGEERHGVVTENAGLLPGAAGLERGALGRHHRVALV